MNKTKIETAIKQSNMNDLIIYMQEEMKNIMDDILANPKAYKDSSIVDELRRFLWSVEDLQRYNEQAETISDKLELEIALSSELVKETN